MRLKRLELHGYKTFASRTEFVFDLGITAIVGPNGSGKSNCADAIRWVLGEQSYRMLRGKSTEDMIFSGSAQRARLGMASASLTFDNSDGWLPVEFSEVTLTRRAYRSGENEYLINNSRVRLRDINELLAKSGLARRSYTVIGQGLVDAVLSLRPEERRTLFEEASGITLYQSKRAEALNRLEETRANLLRVNDIVAEISPLMRRLEREAERAERHAMHAAQLESLLHTWYGYRWHREQIELQCVSDAVSRSQATLEQRRAALDALDARAAELRSQHSALRGQLAAWHQESSELRRQLEEVQRNLAVWRERTRLLAGQAAEIQAECRALELSCQTQAGRVAAAEQELSGCQAALQGHQAHLAAVQAELDALERQRDDLSRQLARAVARGSDVSNRLAGVRSRYSQVEERRAAMAHDHDAHEAALAAQEAQTADLRSQAQTLTEEELRIRARQETLAAQAADLEATLADTESRQAQLRTTLATAQRVAERLGARYDSLARLREEGEGLHAGVRAVLQAAGASTLRNPGRSWRHSVGDRSQPEAGRTGTDAASGRESSALNGVLGTVAQLLEVPPEYEVAIEVALGGHLQDIVVASWADAEAAIGYLRTGAYGRATFLPLNTIRPGARARVPSGLGHGTVLGLGADLVRAAPDLAPVVEMLLGRTLVVRDLAAARGAFQRMQGGFQIVTLTGELLRSNGSVTGGQGQGQVHGQMLAREREWRDLPSRLEAALADVRELELALAAVQAEAQQVRAKSALVAGQRREQESAAARLAAQRMVLERELDHAVQQTTWRREMIAEIEAQTNELKRLEASLQTSLARLAEEAKASQAEADARQAEIDNLHGEALYQRLSDVRTAAAVAQETWEHRRAALSSHKELLAQLRVQMETKQKRLSELEREQAGLADQIREWTARESVIQSWMAALAKKIEPAESEMAAIESELDGLEQQESAARARLREAESDHGQALLGLARHRERVQRLRREIMDDLDLMPPEGGATEAVPDQLRLPLGDNLAPLPVVEELPEGLEEEIQYVRGQMRRIGNFNPNAPQEYAEVRDRHAFLTQQAADLEEAARSLRAVIAELDGLMRSEFHATFRAVAARFRENFARLFGGGSARLMLTDPEDINSTGIEISAQPPGKRPQALALLSGGERALTAVALIFSILDVNPPPFCVLDEVDAMLDEVNVGRFRQALEALNQRTQFIVITHNRGTIQAANTLYGVSMGDDSVSQVVSLRLDGDRISGPDGSPVQLKAG